MPETPETIAHRELRNRSSEVLRRVQAGETLRITNHGQVVAVLVPAEHDLAPRVIPATIRGGFSQLPRVRREEPLSEALDALRGDR
jgi:prevent-host-death family protein